MFEINILLLSIVLCGVLCDDLGLPEDAECVTDGYNGTCVPLFNCESASLTYIFNRQGYTEGIAAAPAVCSQGDKEPIVCCTDCSIDKNKQPYKDSIVDPSGYIVSKRGPEAKALNKCYDYFRDLPYRCRGRAFVTFRKLYNKNKKCHKIDIATALALIGGRDADRWEFPHMALLGFGDNKTSAQWLCGGTIISERFILTAAHCVYSTLLGNVTYAALGLLKRSDPSEYWKIHNIKRAIAHPEYKPPSRYHDIALLETEDEINFGKDVLPACLPLKEVNMYKSGVAAGWGNLGSKKELADVLQVVKLYEFDELKCLVEYPPHRHMKNGFNKTTQMCYGSSTQVADTCQGDSGGPLQTHREKCLYTVQGVTSIGKECGKLGSPAIYSRVQYYVPWIESIVWPDEEQ